MLRNASEDAFVRRLCSGRRNCCQGLGSRSLTFKIGKPPNRPVKPASWMDWASMFTGETGSSDPPSSTKKLVYVGVLTARKYLETRGAAVFQSWARTIPGKLEFYSSADGSNPVHSIPVVSLDGVDDAVYPPQKKSFMMLKYMHDHYLDDYEWFVRSDDDVFIHGDRLGTFLRSLNSSSTLYLGQAGQGAHEEFGRLGLDASDNYCMGGTTMIFSRETLRKMVPHINYCIKHLVSTHEDVEIGRCVRKFAGTHCPWAFEVRTLAQNVPHASSNLTTVGRPNLRNIWSSQ